jgi:hypothetical protein
MPDNGLRTTLDAAAEAFGRQICEIVGKHIDGKLALTTSEASTLDKRDIERAKQVADKYLTTRLGRKMDAGRRTALLDEAASKVGSGRQRRATTTDDEGFVLPACNVRLERLERLGATASPETDRDRQRQTETDRDRQRETERDRERERDTPLDKKKGR